MERRTFLRYSALGLGSLGAWALLPACRRKTTTTSPAGSVPPGFRDLLPKVAGSDQPGLNVALGAGEVLAAPAQRLPIGLIDPDNHLIEGSAAKLWIARGKAVTGPLDLAYRPFSTPESASSHQGGPAKGFYDAVADFSQPGVWDLMVVGAGRYGFTAIEVGAKPEAPGLGQPLPAVKTPTPSDTQGFAAVCTREPPCPMHSISLDAALKAGKPIVLVIATPRLCKSRMCGPVVDEVLSVYNASKGSATFLHAEVYTDANGQNLAPIMDAFHLQSEPWTFLADRSGVVRQRFEGPVAASEVSAALPLALK